MRSSGMKTEHLRTEPRGVLVFRWPKDGEETGKKKREREGMKLKK